VKFPLLFSDFGDCADFKQNISYRSHLLELAGRKILSDKFHARSFMKATPRGSQLRTAPMRFDAAGARA
jgi:hypothetical protein